MFKQIRDHGYQPCYQPLSSRKQKRKLKERVSLSPELSQPVSICRHDSDKERNLFYAFYFFHSAGSEVTVCFHMLMEKNLHHIYHKTFLWRNVCLCDPLCKHQMEPNLSVK